MSSIGPQLPPHLAKRKRDDEEDDSPDSPPSKTTRTNQDGGDSDSDDGYGPSAPRKATTGPTMPTVGPTPPEATATAPPIGPAMPPTTNADEINLDADDDDEDDMGPAPAAPTTKRVLGPAPPPASLSERPPSPPSDSESEDDYGPALPSGPAASASRPAAQPTQPAEPAAPKRDDWMLAPPTSSGYQERDPTKIRSRKFASGASATSRPRDGGEVSSIWTETPEEKARRLADAVLGRGSGGGGAQQQQQQASTGRRGGGAGGVSGLGTVRRDDGGEGREDKIRAFTEQTRGRSLYEEHQAARKAGKVGEGVTGGTKKGAGDEEDDDPSKRAFDWEKDMGLGMKITASQRKELLNRASDFGGRFSKGNYL